MNKRIIRAGIILILPMFLGYQGLAQSGDNSDAAANATNPLAFVTKLQLQPNFTWKKEEARVLNLTGRIIQPSRSIGLPFIKSKDPSKIYTLFRLEIPLIGQTYPKTPVLNATGLSDLILLDVIAFKQNWGLLGTGPALIIPVMKPEPLSSRKWGAGGVLVALNTKTKGLQWGALGQQFFTFGGDENRSSQSFLLLQPIFNKVFAGGRFIQFNPIMNFNWTEGTYNVPLSITFGKAFAKNLSVSIGPEYVISGPQEGDFTIRFNLNAMFPPSSNKD
jgi:hypothetical protein